MVFWIEHYKYPLLISYAMMAMALSAVIKQDAFMLLNLAIVGAVITYVLLKRNFLLLMAATLLSIFNEGVSQFNATYIILYLYILMLASMFMSKGKNKFHISLLIFAVLSLILSILPSLLNGTSFPLLLISIFKRYGFIIIFLFALNILDLNSKYRKTMDISIIVILLLNFVAAFGQFLKGDRTQDFITGFMGPGTTGIFIYLLMYYLAIVSGLHYQKKISTFIYLSLALVPIIYSAFAEVKIGFITCAILMAVYLIFIKRGVKAFAVMLITGFLLTGFYSFFISLYPAHDFLNTAFLEEYLVEQSYGEGNTLNRIGFKHTVDSVVFANHPSEMFFGKGLGSGNPSESSMMQGEVFKKYDFLKYSWFLLPYLYIESGTIGVAIFVIIYLIPLAIAFNHFVESKSSLAIIVLLMGITNFLFIPYNTGLLSYGVITVFWIYTAMMLQEIHQKRLTEKIKDILT